MTIKSMLSGVVVAGFFLMPAGAQANLLVNGGFENTLGSFVSDGNGAMSLLPGSKAIPGWTTTNAELAWIFTPNNFGLFAAEGSYFLDLTGYHDSTPFGGVTQTIATNIGGLYKLTFALGSSTTFGTPDSLLVSAGSAVDVPFLSTANATNAWEPETLFFTASSDHTAINFVGNSGFAYIGLDDVNVTSAVPLPAALPLLGGAVGALGIFGRWRKRRAALPCI
jgi:hypothetical protein